jgi:CRP-like cAMP-binding protein
MRKAQHTVTDDYVSMPLFADLAPCERRAIAGTATRLDLPSGSRVATQGSRRVEFGVITRGTASVSRDGRALGTLHPGDHFGEFVTLRGVPCPATVVADGPITVDVFSGPEFRARIRSSAVVRNRIERETDRRIRDWVRSPLPSELVTA